MTKYTVYIDESGEAGIGKVRTPNSVGASPYMTLGGVLIHNKSRNCLSKHLVAIRETIGKKDLHCCNLTHRQKTYFAREMARAPVVFFGVISYKATLGAYKKDIKSNPTMYFNKCAQYILERVGSFIKQNKVSADDVDIIFEQGLHNYGMFRSLIRKCQENPIRENTKLLRNIKITNISDAPKDREPLLKIADLVAHALFKAVDKTDGNFHIPEPRYLYEIRENFYHCPNTKKIIGHGIMPVHDLKQLELDNDIHSLFDNLKAR